MKNSLSRVQVYLRTPAGVYREMMKRRFAAWHRVLQVQGYSDQDDPHQQPSCIQPKRNNSCARSITKSSSDHLVGLLRLDE